MNDTTQPKNYLISNDHAPNKNPKQYPKIIQVLTLFLSQKFHTLSSALLMLWRAPSSSFKMSTLCLVHASR